MQSTAVTFDLAFPSYRRQLQSSASSAAFQRQLRDAITTALATGLPAEHVTLTAASDDATVLTVTLLSFGNASAAELVATLGGSGFAPELAARLGVTVIMHRQPAVVVRTTNAPLPPPATPAPSPPPPSVPPPIPTSPSISGTITSQAAALSSQHASVSGVAGLSDKMLWVIIFAILGGVICVGCAVAYWCGKQSQTRWPMPMLKVGRPALRRMPNQSGQRNQAVLDDLESGLSATARDDQHDGLDNKGAFLDTEIDGYLIELGRNLERQHSHTTEDTHV